MKLIHGMNPVAFDLYVSSKYRDKANDAKNRGLEFSLTFAEFRRLFARTRCEYTGIDMNLPKLEGGVQVKTNLTIERIDNRLGYVSGNCIAVCYAANNVKSVFENPQSPLNMEHAIRMFSKLADMQKAIIK